MNLGVISIKKSIKNVPITCAVVVQDGSIKSCTLLDIEERSDAILDVIFITMERYSFKMIYNSNIPVEANQRVSYLLDSEGDFPIYGRVIFVLLDEYGNPKNLDIDMFEKLLERAR